MLTFSLFIGIAFYYCNHFQNEPLHIPLSIFRSFLGSFIVTLFFLYDQNSFPETISGALKKYVQLIIGASLGAGISILDWQYSAYQTVIVFIISLFLISFVSRLNLILPFNKNDKWPKSFKHPAFVAISFLMVIGFIYPMYYELKAIFFHSWGIVWISITIFYIIEFSYALLSEALKVEDGSEDYDPSWQKPVYFFAIFTALFSLSSIFLTRT
jgi:hypothetical protein